MPRPRSDLWIGVEGLLDDRLALWLDDWSPLAGRGVRSDSERLHVEGRLDYPEGSARRTRQLPGTGSRDARGIPHATRSTLRLVDRGSGRGFAGTGRCVI